MTSIAQMVEKCNGRARVWLCLQNRVTIADTIEVLPGLNAEVVIKGRPGGNGKKYAPTMVELECSVLNAYLEKRQWAEGKGEIWE